MFSQTVEYALRAMVHIAETPNIPQTTQDIAVATHVPPAYLAKVLRQLAGSNLLVGQRGLGGGFTMSRDPQAITLLEVVGAVEPICRIVSCPLQLEEHQGNMCPLHRKMDGVMEKIERELGITTLGQVVNRKDQTTFITKMMHESEGTQAVQPQQTSIPPE